MPWLFMIIVFFIIMLNVRLRYVNKKYDIEYERKKYLQDEMEANFARAQDLEESMIINLSPHELPFRFDYDATDKNGADILKIQEKIKLNLEMPLIRTGIDTNADVKRRFGASNLQMIIDGEENLTKLIQRLNRWAGLLMDSGNVKDAETVLGTAVKCRSDISETYVLLYDLYTRAGRNEKFSALEKSIDSLPETAKKMAWKRINTR